MPKHSEEQKKKISNSLKGNKNATGHLSWSKGLTKETDERLKKLSDLYGKKYSKLYKGKQDSAETKLRKSIAHKGKKRPPRSKEWCENISIARKGKNCGENNPLYGKHPISPNKGRTWSEEYKQKMSESQKGLQAGEKNPMYGKKRSKEWKEKHREWCLNHTHNNNNKDTSIELLLQNGLIKRGISFQKHIAVCNICIPDIVFPELKIAVFADGDYWHSKTFKNGKQWKKDRNQESTLIQNDWRVLRFWEHDINSTPDDCINQIINVIGGT